MGHVARGTCSMGCRAFGGGAAVGDTSRQSTAWVAVQEDYGGPGGHVRALGTGR